MILQTNEHKLRETCWIHLGILKKKHLHLKWLNEETGKTITFLHVCL